MKNMKSPAMSTDGINATHRWLLARARLLTQGYATGDAPDQFRVTRRAHQRTAGNNVVLNGVLTPVPQPDGTVVLTLHPHFSDLIFGQRSFEIEDVAMLCL